jgi:hypothetical protein
MSPQRPVDGMWRQLRDALMRFRGSPRTDPRQRRADKARAGFWAELREGEREAETQARKMRDDKLAGERSEERSAATKGRAGK